MHRFRFSYFFFSECRRFRAQTPGGPANAPFRERREMENTNRPGRHICVSMILIAAHATNSDQVDSTICSQVSQLSKADDETGAFQVYYKMPSKYPTSAPDSTKSKAGKGEANGMQQRECDKTVCCLLMVGRPDALPMRSTLIMAEETRQQWHSHEEMKKNSSPHYSRWLLLDLHMLTEQAVGFLVHPDK